MSDILNFLAGAGQAGLETWERQRYEASQEEKERRAEYLRLLMSGDYTEPEARELSGYKGKVGREAEMVQSALRRKEEPQRREEATLGQFLEAKRTGRMPEVGEMAPKAFKIYEKHKKFLEPEEEKILIGEKSWRAENPGKTHEDYVRKMKELGMYGRGLSPAFQVTHELDLLKPGKWRPLGKSVQERTKEWREKKKTHQKNVTKHTIQFHKDWRKAKEAYVSGSEDKEEYWKLWKDGIPSEFRYDVGVKLGVKEPFLEKPRKGKSTPVPQTQKEIYNQCRIGGGSIEECKVKAGIE